METAVSAVDAATPTDGVAPGEKGLKGNALGFLSNVVIGVASTAPGYSLAVTLGFIVAVAGVGLQAPAVLIVSFLPMLCIAFAYRYMNRADPDCGTSFAWVTRALGPHLGWLERLGHRGDRRDRDGDARADRRDLHLPALRLEQRRQLDARDRDRGDRLDRPDDLDLLPRDRALGPHAALAADARGHHPRAVRDRRPDQGVRGNPAGSLHVGASWFNPFDISSSSALVDGVLLGVFIYWGWDSGVAVNEESGGAERGRARPLSSAR